VARLKVYGAACGIEQVSQRGDDITLRFAEREKARFDTKKVDLLCFQFENRFKRAAVQEPNPVVQLRGKGLEVEQKLELLERFLTEYKQTIEPKGALQDVAQ
jgi:transcription-repair coupling factor (superfamily II helicase)